MGWAGFQLRSALARRAAVGAVAKPDVVLQIGATFRCESGSGVPYVLYCDSNIKVAERARATQQATASFLTDAELRAVTAREAGIYEGARAIFTLSEQLRRSFEIDFRIGAGRLHTVYAGPNIELERVRDLEPLPGDRAPCVVFVGAEFDRKGGDVLLRAFALVRERVPGARLVIVGPEPRAEGGPGVEWWGYVDKDTARGWARLVEAYRSADVFCLPTRFEPFGIAFVEAMHFGLPCVGTNSWAVPEIIVDGETGFTVPPEDAERLAERLCLLLTNRELALRMGRAGRGRAQELFTWDAVVDRMLPVLESVVRSGR
ncbi:MAG TPA: glycosyltransferase family 4 protein [Gemmatimonadales bacterium]|nr:glycosyltransferase family 4 protein [Gemmatimonadales bacterium]